MTLKKKDKIYRRKKIRRNESEKCDGMNEGKG